jgi:hypothetical protein
MHHPPSALFSLYGDFYVSGSCGKWPDAFFIGKKGFE